MADEIIIRYKAEVDNLVKGLNEVKTEVKTLQKENEQLQTKLGKTFDKPAEKVKSLKTQLKELKAQLADATDPKEVERLARAAGELADKIEDATDAAKVFASESKFEQIGNAFGSVASKVRNLDFSGALQQSKLLLATSKSITFKDAIGGLKDIGGTLKNIGQAVLTNPLFLIAGAVYAAVQVFNDLEASSERVNKTYEDGLAILNASKDAAEAYAKATRELAIENEKEAGRITEQEATKLKNQSKYQDEYKKLLKERAQREKEALEQAEKDREEDGFRQTKNLLEWFGYETDATKAHKQKLKDIEEGFNVQVAALNTLFQEQDEQAQIKANNEELKQQQEANKKLLEEQEKLAKLLRDLRTKNIELEYERRKQIIIDNFEDEYKKYQYNKDIVVELEKKKNRELTDLYNQRKNDNQKILDEAIKSRDAAVKKFIDGEKDIEGEDPAFSKTVAKGIEGNIKKEQKALEMRKANLEAFIEFAQQALNAYSQIYNDNVNAQIQANQDAKDEQLEALEDEYDKKLISQEIYEKRKKAIEDEAAQKERELKKEQFERNKQIAIINATIATAQAVAGAYAQTDKLGYGAFVLAALMGVLGAAQIAAIASQPTPKFEKGGWIDGKRHSQGGTMIEAEKDEFVINRKDAMRNADLLEAINDGMAHEFINQRFVAPMLVEQQRRFEDAKSQSFADNIMNSMMYNSSNFKDSNLLDSLKRTRQSDRENAMYIVKELTKHSHNKRSW